MKLKAVTLKWLNAHFWEKLAKAPQDVQIILANVKNHLTKIEHANLTLPSSSVDYYTALDIFSLKEDQRKHMWILPKDQIYVVPELLNYFLEKLKAITRMHDNNEAYARVVIDQILVDCVMQEKNENDCSTHIEAGVQRSPTPQPSRLTLRFESELSMPVIFKGETRLLTGMADYTLCYGEDSEMETHLVVIEAKKLGCTGAAAGQVASYMGVAHRKRKEEEKINAVVYGVTTDSDEYRFWRIDNESIISKSKTFTWSTGDAAYIISILRHIIRSSAKSPPKTSPIKNQLLRDLSLMSFSTRSERFNYADADLTSDEEQDNMDIVVF